MTFLHGSNKITNLTNITLQTGDREFLSEKSESKGSWYFEYSHFYGDNRYVIGYFCPDDYTVSASPTSHESVIKAYTTGSISLNNEVNNSTQLTSIDLEYNYTYGERVGIGIDLKHHYIHYIYNNISRSFTIGVNCKNWRIVARETRDKDGETYQDFISLHLNNFQYKPPFGAMPWGTQKGTCKQSKIFIFYSKFLIFLIL